MNIKAENVGELLEILCRLADENVDYDFENPENPENGCIIEYDLTEETEPIYWSFEKTKDGYHLYC